MSNRLITEFVFKDTDSKKVDDLNKKLTESLKLQNGLANFGGNTTTSLTNFNNLTTSLEKLERQTLSSEKKAQSLATQFNKLNSGNFKSEANVILLRLQAIDAQLKKKPSDAIFKTLTSEAKELSRELTNLERKAISLKSNGLSQPAATSNASIIGGSFVGNLGATAVTELTSAVISGGRAVLDYSSNLEQARIGLTTMTGSADVAASHLKDLQNFAKTTPFEFSELVTASQKLQGVGFSAQKVIPTLRDVGSALAASGRISELPFAIKALGDIQAKGKLAGQEIIQLANAGIPAVKVLSGALNKSSAEILKLSENGQISSEIFLKALHQYSQSNFGGALEAQSKTFGGAISNIKDALGQTSEVAFRPLFQKVSTIANDISAEVGRNENDLEKVGAAIASNVAKGFGTILRDQFSREVQNIGEGKSDPLSLYKANVGVGEAFAKGTLGERTNIPDLLESSRNLSREIYANRSSGDLDQLNLEIRDTETLNFFGKFNKQLEKLYAEKQEILNKIVKPIAVQNALTDGIVLGSDEIGKVKYTFDTATSTISQTAVAAKTLSTNLGDAGKQAAKLAELVNKVKISDVENNLNYSKAVAASQLGGVALIQQNKDLEISALKKRIEINNQFATSSIKTLSDEDFAKGKGSEIAFRNTEENARLQNQIAVLQITSQKQIADEIKNTNKQLKDLEKTYNSVFRDLVAQNNSDNPFFADARNEMDKLKESVKGLSPELQKQAIALQQNINSNRLFESRLDNALAVEDLQDTAARFRKLPKPTRELFDNAFKDFVEKKTEEIKTAFNQIRDETGKLVGISQSQINPFIRYNAITGGGGLSGFTRTDIRDNPFTAFDRLADGSTLRRERTFNDLTDKEKRELIDRFSITSDDQISANQRLQRQFDIINTKIATGDERGIADRKILGIAGNLDPSKLNKDQREQIAAAAEREASRRKQYEDSNLQLQRDMVALQGQIAANTANLRGIANEKGTEGLNDYIRVSLEDKRSTGNSGSHLTVADNYGQVVNNIREGFDNSLGGRSR